MENPKKTLAVALIVKNESANLDACLGSVKDFVDEIVVLDSSSTDGTRQIARQYTPKVYNNPDWPGFGPQRRVAQQYVTSDYVLWLDADERVSPELQKSIEQAMDDSKENTVYAVSRLSRAFGRYIRHCGWYPDYVVRLYPVQLTQYDTAMVHEKVQLPDGVRVEILKGELFHHTYEDMEQYLKKSVVYARAWAKQQAKKGKKTGLLNGLSHALARFLKMYLLQAGFLDGRQGLLLSVLSAHSTFIKYAQLWLENTQEVKGL